MKCISLLCVYIFLGTQILLVFSRWIEFVNIIKIIFLYAVIFARFVWRFDTFLVYISQCCHAKKNYYWPLKMVASAMFCDVTISKWFVGRCRRVERVAVGSVNGFYNICDSISKFIDLSNIILNNHGATLWE